MPVRVPEVLGRRKGRPRNTRGPLSKAEVSLGRGLSPPRERARYLRDNPFPISALILRKQERLLATAYDTATQLMRDKETGPEIRGALALRVMEMQQTVAVERLEPAPEPAPPHPPTPGDVDSHVEEARRRALEDKGVGGGDRSALGDQSHLP